MDKGTGIIQEAVCEAEHLLPHAQHDADPSPPVSRLLSTMTDSLSVYRGVRLFCLRFIARMLRSADESHYPAVVIQRGLRHALQAAIDITSSPRMPCRLRVCASEPTLQASTVRDCLVPIEHLLRNRDQTSVHIVETFRSMVETGCIPTDNNSTAHVVYHAVTGPSIGTTTALPNTIVMDLPTARDFRQQRQLLDARDHIVALYDCSLELMLNNDGRNVALELAQTPISEESLEYRQLRSFADYLQRSHVTLVVCQKRVHPYLQRLLRARGILLVYRVSVRYMAALQTLSGGRVHSSLPVLTATSAGALDPAGLGYLHQVHCQHLFGRSYVSVVGFPDDRRHAAGSAGSRMERLQDQLLDAFAHLGAAFALPFVNAVVRRQQSYCTILLTAPNDSALELWRLVYEHSLQRLHLLSAHSAQVDMLPGGGIWQAFVARELRLKLARSTAATPSRIGGQLQRVREVFAHCLEECALAAGATLRSDGPDGAWGHDRIHDFVLPSTVVDCGAAVPAMEAPAPQRKVFRNPDGDVVVVVWDAAMGCYTLGSAEDHAFGDGRSSAGAAEAVKQECRGSPPLDDLGICMKALHISVDAVCTVLSIGKVEVVADEG